MGGLFRKGAEHGGTTPGHHDKRFPGYDVLGQTDTWDVVTAGVVLARLGRQNDLRFFSCQEEATGRALVDQLLDQREDPKVPVLEMIDARLSDKETDGWRYEDMPEDGEAWRRSLRALDEDAQQACGKSFAACSWEEQAELIQAVQDRGSQDWHGMRAHHVWSLWTRYACAAFYSHPWAWNEIGFGGPAYPRGYKHIGFDAREPWEVPDQVDRDPVSWGERVERARRRRAVKPRQETEGGDSAHGSGGAVSATPGES